MPGFLLGSSQGRAPEGSSEVNSPLAPAQSRVTDRQETCLCAALGGFPLLTCTELLRLVSERCYPVLFTTKPRRAFPKYFL